MEFKTPDIQTSDSPLWTTWEGHQLWLQSHLPPGDPKLISKHRFPGAWLGGNPHLGGLSKSPGTLQAPILWPLSHGGCRRCPPL